MKERIFKKAVKFINFSFVSTTTFALQLFLTVLFTELIGFAYYISHAIALVIAWTVCFIFHMKLTFGVGDRIALRFGRFTALAVTSSFLNWFLVLAAVEYIGMHYFISIILVSLGLALFTFTTEELWVFRKARVEGAAVGTEGPKK
jgi:putative flippase GtrA